MKITTNILQEEYMQKMEKKNQSEAKSLIN